MSAPAAKLSQIIAPVFFAAHLAVKGQTHGEIWLPGGRGSGKSSFVSIEIILGIMQDPQANAIIFRKVARTLRESVYNQMLWAIQLLGVAHLWRRGLSPMELVYQSTGQRVLFRGADDPQKSKGLKLKNGFFKYLWFEELSEFHGMQEIRTVTVSVVRGGSAVIFYSYNPPINIRNWVNREQARKAAGRLVVHSAYLDLPPQWLGPDFLAMAQELKRANPRAYRHEYLGQATGTGAQVFDNITLRAISQQERASFDRICMGVDWGWYPDPFHWVKLHYDAARNKVYLLDELRAWRTPNAQTARALMERHGVTARDLITADSAEKKSVQEYRDLGLYCRGAAKGPGSVEYAMKRLQSLAEIVIDPHTCPYAAEEFGSYEYHKDRAGEILGGYPDRDNHAIDAVRYALEKSWRLGTR